MIPGFCWSRPLGFQIPRSSSAYCIDIMMSDRWSSPVLLLYSCCISSTGATPGSGTPRLGYGSVITPVIIRSDLQRRKVSFDIADPTQPPSQTLHLECPPILLPFQSNSSNSRAIIIVRDKYGRGDIVRDIVRDK